MEQKVTLEQCKPGEHDFKVMVVHNETDLPGVTRTLRYCAKCEKTSALTRVSGDTFVWKPVHKEDQKSTIQKVGEKMQVCLKFKIESICDIKSTTDSLRTVFLKNIAQHELEEGEISATIVTGDPVETMFSQFFSDRVGEEIELRLTNL